MILNKLDAKKILARANKKRAAHHPKSGFAQKYSEAEAILEALVEAINDRFEEQERLIESLGGDSHIHNDIGEVCYD